MAGKFLPPTPPSTQSCSLNPAFTTCSPFNTWNLGHCKQVCGPALPTEPPGCPPWARPWGCAQDAGSTSPLGPALCPGPGSPSRGQLVLRLVAPEQRPFKVEAYINRLVSQYLSWAFGQMPTAHLNKQERKGKIPSRHHPKIGDPLGSQAGRQTGHLAVW